MQGLQVGARISRIGVTQGAEVLARVTEDRIAAGGAVVVSLAPLRERLADGWPAQQEAAFAVLAAALPPDACARITELEAVIIADGDAQLLAFTAAGAAVEAASGAFDAALFRLLSVRSLDGDDLACAELDPSVAAGPSAEPEAPDARTPVVFTGSNGQRLQVEFALEPIRSLKHGVTAVLRVEPTVTFQATGEVIPAHRFHRLADGDMARIDAATLAFGALHVPEDAALQPPVILPVSFRTMGGRKGRHLLVATDGLSPERVRQGAMIEFVDIGRGTPAGRVVEVASLVARVTRGVLARLQAGRDALKPVKGARFNGLTMDFAELGLPERQLGDMLRAMAHQMRGAAPALIAQGLGETLHLDMAEAAGFTHAGVRGARATVARREVA